MNMYSILANTRILKVFGDIKTALESANKKFASYDVNDITQWIRFFIEGLNKELPLSPKEFRLIAGEHIRNVQRFGHLLLNELPNLQDQVLQRFLTVKPSTVTWTGTDPSVSTFTKLWGCKAYCPFCQEPCQKSDPEHITIDKNDFHTCIQHRPVGINGTHFVTHNQMAIEVCNFKVQSNETFSCAASHFECRNSGNCEAKDTTTYHPFREYKTVINAWDIAPNSSMKSTDFWSWYLVTNVKKICERYRMKLPDVPEIWKHIKKEQAVISLRKALN